ncbi:glycosyltransferase family 4 protein [Thermodesulfovibrionales bacterium]|nr:glycosyltransferase family 4 protein [Thermodesulfovibrionales bacterium]
MSKKILLINDKYGEFGGTEEYINSFASLFGLFGYEISIIYGKKYPKNFSNSLIKEFPLEAINERNTSAPYKLDGLRDYLNGIKPDIIYLHNIFDRRVVTLLKEASAKKIIWYCHDHFFYCLTELKILDDFQCELPSGEHCIENIKAGRCMQRYPLSGDLKELFWERKRLLEATSLLDEIVVISEYMKSTLLQNNPSLEERINLVPRQVYIPERVKREKGGKNILYVGRVVKEKGVDYLIKAMEFINCKDATLIIIGGGDDLGYVKRCQSLAEDLREKKGIEVIFTGWKSHREVSEFYERATVTCVPSIFPEPFGVVTAEALAHEVPVVAYDVGGISTVIKDGKTGLLAEPGNIRDLGKKIEHLFNNKEENLRMGEEGRRFVKEEFNSQRRLDAIAQLFGLEVSSDSP